MKKTSILIVCLIVTLQVLSQEYNVKIEIQLIGYDGFSPFEYSISNGNYYRNYISVQPDSSGRIIIHKKIDSTKFFRFHYRNANKERIGYECRLILQPNNNYTIVAKGFNYNDAFIPYSPDIFSWKIQKGDEQNFYKMDKGQIYYNLFDNGTQGYVYEEEWDLLQPDSLLGILKRKIHEKVKIYTDLLEKGEINQEFFEIAKLNVEYFTMYRLAKTIESTWTFPGRFGIEDSVINEKLVQVYQRLFELFPIEGTKLENLFLSERIIDVYLEYLECFNDGKFSVPEKGSDYRNQIEELRPIISEEVYKDYKMQTAMSRVGTLELESSKLAKEFLKSNPDMKNTFYGDLLENVLIPRSEAFDNLSQRELPHDVVFLDEEETIQSYSQLTNKLENKPALVNFWGTWCGPCKFQFQFKDSLKAFLDENGIEMIYAAYEYKPDRKKWKKIIAAYELTGNHFIVSDSFKNDIEKYGGEISAIPIFMLINEKGEIVEPKAYFPSDGQKLIDQVKDKLINH